MLPIEPERVHADNLPVPLTSFVGRERDMAAIQELFAKQRLLTLVGSGGIGKTRLAVCVAGDWTVDGHQVGGLLGFVDLTALMDPDLVPQIVASQLGVPEQAGRAVVARLIDELHDKAGLLVIDNCEHMVEACARLVEGLLTTCPELRVLATSRERLGIEGEVIWRVPSLESPEATLDSSAVASSEAARLFVERARAVLPTFEIDDHNVEAVGEVCRRLDGIPLALELAAARVSLLTVPEIAARLDDALGLLVTGRRLAQARQQTVRATIDWSYALLTEPERDLFERLSVFVGGFTLEAAEAIAQTGAPTRLSTLQLLGRLVDTSMVTTDPAPTGRMRYRLLETLKQYGVERLSQRALVNVLRGEHATYFVALAEQVEPDLSSPRVKSAQVRLEAEHDNLRAALGWLVEQVDVDGAQRLAGALARFWFFRGYLAEAEAWLTRALDLPGSDRPAPGRAKCVQGLAMLGIGRGDYLAVERFAHDSAALWHAVGNQTEEAFSLFHLGMATLRLGKYDAARANLEAGLEVSRAAGAGAAEANCLFTLADLALDIGNNEEARNWAQAALVRATAIGRARQTAAARGFLGVLSTREGDYHSAATILEASLATWRELGEPYWIAEALVRLGQLAIDQTDIASARNHLAEGLKMAQQQADRHRIATALEGFVQVAVVEQDPRLALELAAAAEAMRTAISVPLPPAERAYLTQYLLQARNSVGNQAAETACTHGRGLTVEEAIDLALADARRHEIRQEAKRGRNLLTAREQMVARLVARGLTNRQIAEQLVIAEGTAERHVGNILAKLEMTARTQIAVWAVAQGLLPSEISVDM